MAYQALYRKWRPVTFEDVSGQDAIATTLKNQVRTNRVGHAYLFTGTRGTGKTTAAKILARAVNCPHSPEHGGDPCNECEVCKSILEGRSLDVFEIDAASNNGVDNIRDIREQVEYPPSEGSYKVYIIDEVHMLSTGAFNALLKTLEEPPSYVMFILATTDPQKIPQTILSRCQRYDFRRISRASITERLRKIAINEGMDIEDKAYEYIASAADGSMRDALSILDQCMAYHYGSRLSYDAVLGILGAADTDVYSDLFRATVSGDAVNVIQIIDSLIASGCEPSMVCSDFLWYMRNILLAAGTGADSEIIDIQSDHIERLAADARLCTKTRLIKYIGSMAELSNRMRTSTQKRVILEAELIRLCSETLPEERSPRKVQEASYIKELPKEDIREVSVSPKISIELTDTVDDTVPFDTDDKETAKPDTVADTVPFDTDEKIVSMVNTTDIHMEKGVTGREESQEDSGVPNRSAAASPFEVVVANWEDMMAELLPSNRSLFKDTVLKDEKNSILVIFRNKINFRLAAKNSEENGLLKLRELAFRKYGISTNFTARIAQPGEIAEKDNTFTDEELGKINFPIDFEN